MDETNAAGHALSDELNLPDVLAEVRGVFEEYEQALVGNDVPTLRRLFWDSPHTIRHGANENLYGTHEIDAFRKERPSAGLMRTLTRVEIRSFGRTFATTNAEFARETDPRVGRQTQTLVKFPEIGWRIVSAHVSWMS